MLRALSETSRPRSKTLLFRSLTSRNRVAARSPVSARDAVSAAAPRAWRKGRRGSARKPPARAPRTSVCLPAAGLTTRELAALAGCDPAAVADRATALEPTLRGGVEATLAPELVELVAEDLALPIALEVPKPLFGPATAAAGSGKSGGRRAPVVTVMGHVDHGKTTLLDALRATDVAGGEAGGITQRIGAFPVRLAGRADGNSADVAATFLDTPGHAAFTEMRAAGTHATDIVVLAVAADDGVMPQTAEAAALARAAGVPVVVAVTKADAPGADPARVRAQLAHTAGIITEEVGGDTLCVDVSAKTGAGLVALTDSVLLQAEILEITADPELPARMVVIESRQDRATGPQATVIVRDGSVRPGDHVVFQAPSATQAADITARVRALVGMEGAPVQRAYPGEAVALVGLRIPPPPGALALVVPEHESKRMASAMAARNQRATETVQLAHTRMAALAKTASVAEPVEEESDATRPPAEEEDAPPERRGTLNVLVKGDVQGSADAVALCLAKLGTPVYGVRVLRAGVGDVNPADVALAGATAKVRGTTDDALIVAFNVRAGDPVVKRARRAGVDIIRHELIYHLEDAVRARVAEHEARWTTSERSLGRARVVRVFEDGAVAGCSVDDGSIASGARARVLRFPDGKTTDVTKREVVHAGKISSLKHFAEDVRSAGKGSECGLGFVDWADFKPGDIVESIEVVQGTG